MAYQSPDQLLELLRLLYELGDQLHNVKMIEPPDVQLQALLENPMRQRNRTKGATVPNGNEAIAWWQLRVLDLAQVVGARHWVGAPVHFNLALTDPVTPYLADSLGWQGIGGQYTVTVGDPSRVEDGHTDGLPLVTAGVGAFTRLWFGVAPASSLKLTDPFDAPLDLCAQLDQAFRLPPTVPRLAVLRTSADGGLCAEVLALHCPLLAASPPGPSGHGSPIGSPPKPVARSVGVEIGRPR